MCGLLCGVARGRGVVLVLVIMTHRRYLPGCFCQGTQAARGSVLRSRRRVAKAGCSGVVLSADTNRGLARLQRERVDWSGLVTYAKFEVTGLEEGACSWFVLLR